LSVVEVRLRVLRSVVLLLLLLLLLVQL
jgi:hypothetical protein